MRRVYALYALRLVANTRMLKFYAAVLCAATVASLVSLGSIMGNARWVFANSGTEGIGSYLFGAVSETTFGVQLLLAAALVFAIWFARDLVRTDTYSTTRVTLS